MSDYVAGTAVGGTETGSFNVTYNQGAFANSTPILSTVSITAADEANTLPGSASLSVAVTSPRPSSVPPGGTNRRIWLARRVGT